MPAVAVVVAGQPQAAHRKVTLTGADTTVTLDVTSPEVLFDVLADEWIETPRPGSRPFLERASRPLRRLSFDAKFGVGGDIDITDRLVALVQMAHAGRILDEARRSITVSYSGLESALAVTNTGSWTITSLSIRSLRRRADNTISRASLSIELTESSLPLRPGRPGTSPTSPGAVAANPTATPSPKPDTAPRRSVVAAGDSLWSIAQRFYGDGGEWRRIAEANGIRDPRRLAAGQTLVLP